VEFLRVRGMTCKTFSERGDAHAEDLSALFEKETGFTLTIPRILGINA
jgi:hypothetical protein